MNPTTHPSAINTTSFPTRCRDASCPDAFFKVNRSPLADLPSSRSPDSRLRSTIRKLGNVAAALTAATLLSACSGPGIVDRTGPAVRDSAPFTVTLDGNIEEWPADIAAIADENYLYLRMRIAGEPFTLQTAPETTAIWIDADANAATGKREFFGPEGAAPTGEQTLGVDLEFQFSPIDFAKGTLRRGVAISTIARDGSRTKVARTSHDDFAFAPTYAAQWYEVRIARHLVASLPANTAFTSRGKISGGVMILNNTGTVEGFSPLFATNAPARSAARPLLAATIPQKPDDAIRVISYNVLRSAPMTKPDGFKAIFQATNPDVILVQEWEADADALKGWFTAMLPPGSAATSAEAWHAVAAEGTIATGGGVGIISRFPLAFLDLGIMEAPNDKGDMKPVRSVSAIADTPWGRMLLTSTHLKCCGSSGSWEDTQRLEEARILATRTRRVLQGENVPYRVIAGDMNLVGSRPPLDVLRLGISHTATDLTPIDARVLGDRAFYTWAENKNDFTPGRLDYILAGTDTMQVLNAFILDTTRLDEASLARTGLAATDSLASDHLPVIVDLKPMKTK